MDCIRSTENRGTALIVGVVRLARGWPSAEHHAKKHESNTSDNIFEVEKPSAVTYIRTQPARRSLLHLRPAPRRRPNGSYPGWLLSLCLWNRWIQRFSIQPFPPFLPPSASPPSA